VTRIRYDDVRLQHYGLDPSHEWWKSDGDCWDDEHSQMWCDKCEIIPFIEDPCYHELPYHNLPSAWFTVNPDAKHSCLVID